MQSTIISNNTIPLTYIDDCIQKIYNVHREQQKVSIELICKAVDVTRCCKTSGARRD